MREFANIERRIHAVCSPASIDGDATRMLAEIGDVLALGYVSALRADAAFRRLEDGIERLASHLDDADSVAEVQRLVQERRTIDEATCELRARLGVLRTLFAHVSARVDAA